ncbi:MAG: BamA/TamA family outer membrane protein [Bacteroidales bacterium]|nr:BamA/TamA family outer membrane protein [Bacteroidales bacterium]
MRRNLSLFLPVLFLIFAACNSLKYVPKDQYLLKRVSIEAGKGSVKSSDLRVYLSQEPNKKFLGLFNLDLFWYNSSGQDTSKWINRTLRKIGNPPVIFDSLQAMRSGRAMQNSLISKGYFDADVDWVVAYKGRKASVRYVVKPNKPYTIRKYDFVPVKDSISLLIEKEMKSSTVRPGMLLSSQKLDEERSRLSKRLMREGYYAMQKDFFSFDVDSTLGTHQADVNLLINPYLPDTSGMELSKDELSKYSHPVYRVQNIFFMLDVPMSSFTRNPVVAPSASSRNLVFEVADFDTISRGSYHTIYRKKPFVSPEALIENCRILPGEIYDLNMVERTYSRMNSLQLMKYINIRFVEQGVDSLGMHQLDCYIVLTPNLKQAMAFELEGTNTAGDIGIAGNLNYTHRNLFNGSELFQAKVRGAYEALSTSFQSDYTELGGEVSMTLPEFKMFFLSEKFKKNVDATTELNMSFQKMKRPEFERTIASTGIRYNWLRNNLRQTLDLIDISYVYMPWVDSTFQTNYLTNTSYLKYSYEDHFILRTGYSFSYSSVPLGSTNRSYFTLRGSLEAAGNSLYAIYSLAKIPKDQGFYKIGGINFAQYVKGEAEYAKSHVIDSRSRLAWRFGLGIAYPYGNSSILPFEKRFFSGGANSVRGWSVRTLGPGSYYSGRSNGIDFMNQSGDVKLDFGAEYRNNLFWKLESALFADFGNIWTLREYAEQPGGQFKINTFYKQLASSVGVGLRFDFNYFLLRFDLGMKVFDPSLTGDQRWRIKYIDNKNDFAFHFAIGYPF